ncbi:MAG: resolvase, partial [Pseudobutyrivibrio sp.]|nr:resolvase [Pseudobutyrivibrio sp.]
MITTFEEALKRIEELEIENTVLKEELEEYRNRNYSGRKKHNAAWMESYTDFEIKYENGMSIM